MKDLFGISHPQSMHVFCDNQAVLDIAKSPVSHNWTKHRAWLSLCSIWDY